MKAAAVLAGAALALAGCTPPGTIKAFDGPDPGADGVAVVETNLQNDTFLVVDNEIVAVDGKRYPRKQYSARMLPGVHWIGTQGTMRGRGPAREQFCAFELNAVPGCTYRPAMPGYPRALLDQPASDEWRINRPITVVADCGDASYAIQVPLECAGKPLCRVAGGFAACP